MNPLDDSFFDTVEGEELYERSVLLYEKIERENAHTAHVNGIIMGYLEFGSSDGIPLIWAHGSALTSYEMVNVQEGLVKAGYRVISIDYRGHGKTQIENTGYNTSLYHIADDIAALMDCLDIPRAVVGGLSKGGWIAAAFYDTYPRRTLGLLLEDGGSFSALRWKEDIKLKVVSPGVPPSSAELYGQMYDPAITYETRLEALKIALAVYYPAVLIVPTVEYFCTLLSMFYKQADERWAYHCDQFSLMCDKASYERKVVDSQGIPIYSKLPIMQQSQELMLPFVVFRNLDVPMHIIDPVSPTDWMDVYHQNKELQEQHPDWVVHEVYEYEVSPHEAHYKRPERFVESATALLERVKSSVLQSTK